MKKTNTKLVRNLILVLKKVYKLTSHYKPYFILAFFFILILECLDLAASYFFRNIINFFSGFSGENNIDYLVYAIVGMISAYFIRSILNYFHTMMVVKFVIKISHELTLKVFNKLLGLSLGYHEKENTGAKLRKLDKGTDDVRTILDRTVWDIAPALIRIAASFIFLVFIDYRMAIAFLVIIPFFLYTTLQANKKSYPLRKNIWKGFEKVYGGFGQAIYNVKTVQSYVQEEREEKKGKSGAWQIMKKQFKYILGYCLGQILYVRILSQLVMQ